MEYLIVNAVNDHGEETTKLIREETIDREGNIGNFFSPHEGIPTLKGRVIISGDHHMMGDVYVEEQA